jgi:hypothetical protein
MIKKCGEEKAGYGNGETRRRNLTSKQWGEYLSKSGNDVVNAAKIKLRSGISEDRTRNKRRIFGCGSNPSA